MPKFHVIATFPNEDPNTEAISGDYLVVEAPSILEAAKRAYKDIAGTTGEHDIHVFSAAPAVIAARQQSNIGFTIKSAPKKSK